MKTEAVKQYGDVSVFESIDLPKPQVKPGYILIRTAATSVNPVDCKIRSGLYASLMSTLPAILHGDVAGTVEEVGAGITKFKKGDEVYGCAGGVNGEPGALSEFMLADSRLMAIKPKSLSMAQAAALPLVSITAWEALFEKIQIKPGQKVLIHAGTGGVGHIAIQLAKWAGADVYTTISSPEKAKIAKQFGVTAAINYQEEAVADYVQRLTGGKGFDVVFDTVGGDNLDKSFEAVAHYGNVITIQGNSSHHLGGFYFKSASLHAVLMLLPLLLNQNRERHGKILAQIANLVDEGVLKPLIDANQFSYSEVGKAHALLESGKALGKVVVQSDYMVI